jgi:hypothetical protein
VSDLNFKRGEKRETVFGISERPEKRAASSEREREREKGGKAGIEGDFKRIESLTFRTPSTY